MDKVMKGDAAGALGSARDMVSQLQQQAKAGQIDGAVLDQLEAILNVTVDAASDKQPELKSGAGDVSGASSLSSAPTPSGESKVPSSASSVPSSLVKDEIKPTTDAPATEPTSVAESADTTSLPEDKTSEKKDESMDSSSVSKADEPMSARPPQTNLLFDHVDEIQSKLPEFIKAMENGHVGDAQKIAGGDTRKFDEYFGAAQHALLNEGGWNSENMAKLNGLAASDTLKKSITAASVPGIYLIRLAKLMLPVYAGLTQRLPADSPKTIGSTQATWRAQLGFGALAEAGFFRVAEASIGVNPPTNFLTFNAPYDDIAANDSVTLKALRTSMGYSDPLQIGVIKAMSALLRGQERVILGSNNAAIATPAAPTVTQGAPSESVIAAGSYVVGVSALTYEGWVNQSVGGSAVGETIATFANQFVLGAGSSILMTWAAVPGAVAYNVYVSGSSVSAGSAAKWNKTVLVNKAVISAVSTGSNGCNPGDTTVNATYGIESILTWCELATVYGNAIPSKQTITDNAGAGLTTGNGGISQYDTILANLWVNWHTAPSLMLMSPNMNASLVGKLQALGAGNFYRIDVGAERNQVNGGLMVSGYVNKFAPFADGTPRMIDIIPHPYMPDGTVLFVSETIPYPMANESRGFVRDVLLPYTYFPLPSQAGGVNQTTYNFTITTSETVECFNPGPQAALVGVDYTL